MCVRERVSESARDGYPVRRGEPGDVDTALCEVCRFTPGTFDGTPVLGVVDTHAQHHHKHVCQRRSSRALPVLLFFPSLHVVCAMPLLQVRPGTVSCWPCGVVVNIPQKAPFQLGALPQACAVVREAPQGELLL